MPPLALHTAIAKQVADHLSLTALTEERGSLYLGATAPDIRIMTRWERERTHFFDVHQFNEQSGVGGFFAAHPRLADPGLVGARTLAFVSGYVTHLVMDETWIRTVYRPYFGERSPLGGDLKANVMDRALQFSMDAERRGDRDLMRHILEAVSRFEIGIEIGFIDMETLSQWRDLVIEIVDREPDWERFRQGARRHLELRESDVNGFDELTSSLPDIVDETLRYLTPERVSDYLHDAFLESLAAVKGYLQCG